MLTGFIEFSRKTVNPDFCLGAEFKMRLNGKDDIPRIESGEKIKLELDFSDIGEKVSKNRKIIKIRYSVFLLAFLILFAIIGTFIFKKSQDKMADFEPNADASSIGEIGAWQGAFESQEIFEACRKSTVLIIAGDKRCSGFVYTSDGWIVTVEGVVNDNVKGRIEVVLFDGERYFVEAFRQNRQSGITLMKINATNLKAADNFGDGEIFAGEDLFSFCFVGNVEEGGSLFSGKVSHTQRTVDVCRADGTSRKLNLLQIGILLTDDGVGAPLFNAAGELVGIACASGEKNDEPFMVDYAYAFFNVKSLISTMKDGKTVDSDQLSMIIVE